MHKKTICVLFVILALITSSCAQKTVQKEANTAEPSKKTGATLELTLEELATYNGKDGHPAYIAVDGVIYDVSSSSKWKDGEHNGYKAGNDLTDVIKKISPHGLKMLERLNKVGTIKLQ